MFRGVLLFIGLLSFAHAQVSTDWDIIAQEADQSTNAHFRDQIHELTRSPIDLERENYYLGVDTRSDGCGRQNPCQCNVSIRQVKEDIYLTSVKVMNQFIERTRHYVLKVVSSRGLKQKLRGGESVNSSEISGFLISNSFNGLKRLKLKVYLSGSLFIPQYDKVIDCRDMKLQN